MSDSTPNTEADAYAARVDRAARAAGFKAASRCLRQHQKRLDYQDTQLRWLWRIALIQSVLIGVLVALAALR